MDGRPHTAQNGHVKRFFGVVVSGQSYLNILYLFLAFPLGLFYFIFLITGLSLGTSLLIIWVGVPILLFMLVAWWALVSFERQLAIWLLRIDIPPMSRENTSGQSIWTRLKAHLKNPVTWKGLGYLFAKFPLGVLSFSVVVALMALTAGLVAAPILYQSTAVSVGDGGLWIHDDNTDGYTIGSWHVDTLGEALFCSVMGVWVFLISLHIINAMAFAMKHFTRLMLGTDEPTSRMEGMQKEDMMNGDERYEERYKEAKEKVEAIKGFYIHLITYVCVNGFLIAVNLITSRRTLWFYWPLLGWGAGVLAHGIGVFGFDGLLGKDWEKKKIREIMEKTESDDDR
ncbi:sensor domain-containing protein [Candidatus Poribacteria bacterium]